MLISGFKSRSMPQREVFSFVGDLSFDSTLGYGRYGFSGDGSQFQFLFDNGRILDPNYRYIGSYLPDTSFNLSGNYQSGQYNYYLNGDYIAESSVDHFVASRFFFDSSGHTLDINSQIMTTPVLYDFDFPTGFVTGQTFTWGLENQDSGKSFEIFSGEALLGGTLTDQFYFPGSQFPATVGTGLNISLVPSGVKRGETYDIGVNLFTNFGLVNTGFSVIHELPPYSWNWTLTDYNNSGLVNLSSVDGNASSLILESGEDNQTVYSNWNLFHTISPTSEDKSLYISLSYDSGETGVAFTSDSISGVQILGSGEGYSTNPTVVFSGDGVGAAAEAFIEENGFLSGINMISGGSGYSTVVATLEGGGPPTSEGSIEAILTGYGKNYHDGWYLYTGQDSNSMASFADLGYFGADKFETSIVLPVDVENLLISVGAKTYEDTSLVYSTLTVSGRQNIETVTISGGQA